VTVHPAMHARPRPGLTLSVLCLAAFAYILLQSMVIPALPTIAAGLHCSETSVTWVLTAYLLSASVATPVLGRLGDIYGKKLLLLIVLVSLAVGAVVAATTSSLSVMIVARVIQGGGGAIFPLAFSIIRDEFPRARVAGAIGLMSALIGIGAGVAIVAAGPIVDHLSFHWLFWIPGGMSLIAAAAAFIWVPESPIKAPGRINLVSAIMLSSWLICLLLAVSQGASWGWTSPRLLGLLAAAVVMFAAWLASELRSPDPLVDVRVMRVPTVWWTNISAALIGFGMYSLMVAVPAFMQTPTSAGYGFGASTTSSGFALLPMSFAMLVAGILTGRLTGRYGSKVPLVLGSAISAAGMLLLAAAHSAIIDVYIAMGLVGLGIGFAFSAMSNLIVEAVPSSQTGVATGMNANVRTIGGSIGSQVVATLIVAGVAAGALPHEQGYVLSFVVLAVALVAAAVTAAMVPNRAARRAASPGDPSEAHEFDELAADASAVAAAEAGLAIGERLESHYHHHH
jgi:EmrB/QacA subfamily drug resistance transporter